MDLRRLHSLGLLSGAFRPEEGIRVLRCYLRQRANLIRYASHHIQHMQKALEQMNVELTEAVSDITGKTGLSIIKAILAGERDPTRLAGRTCDRRCQQDAEQIARALQRDLEGGAPLRVEAGGRALGVLPPTNRRLRRARIQTHLQTLQDPNAGEPPAPKVQAAWRKRKANGPRFDGGGRCTG